MADVSWIEKQKWFHAIDFGDRTSSAGRFSADVPPNYTLYGVFDYLEHIDLAGMTCLDIGTMDGITAFTMKAAGAGSVFAADMEPRPSFLKGRDLLGLDIGYITPCRIDQLPDHFEKASFDLIVNAGILYHIFDPLQSLVDCRAMLKTNGLMILETQYMFDEPRAVMAFNPGEKPRRRSPHANTFWRPSKQAVEGMLRLAGFDVLSTRSINGRITLLAQAIRPSEGRAGHDKIRQIHAQYMKYKNYGEKVDFNWMNRETAESQIGFSGARDDRFLFRSLYRPASPFQPPWNPPFLTKAKTVLGDFKYWIGTAIARLRPGRRTT